MTLPCTSRSQSTERDAMIVNNLKLVRQMAQSFATRVPPCVTAQDLASAGTIGLIEAVDRFDRNRGLKFITYAQHRIRGAMQDHLRAEDALSRTERRRRRESDETLPVTVSLADIPASVLDTPQDGHCHAAAGIVTTDLERARQRLSPREDKIIGLLYDHDCGLREVAEQMGVTQGRISQIKHRAIAKMQRYVSPGP